MREEVASVHEDELDPWLASARSDLIDGLASVLDVEAGLRDALLPSRRTDLTDDLRAVLDLDTGLAAIIPSASLVRFEQPRFFPPADAANRDTSEMRESATARLICSLPPAHRLALREDPAIPGIALAFRLAQRTARARDLEQTRDRDVARALALILTHDLDLARGLARALDLARPRVPDLARAHTRAQGLTRKLEFAIDLTHNLDHNRDLGLDLDRDLAHVLARDLARGLADAVALARDLSPDPDLARAFDSDLGPAHDRDLGLALARACDDFSAADLRDVDLTGMPLTGVRWSRATQWPTAWKEQIERRSEEIEPGLFEIRDGTARADTSTVFADH